MFITLRNQILQIGLFIAFLSLFVFRLALPIDLTSVDIGRHIKNGELVLQGQWEVLYKNFYSFTCPDYPFINHHWFFGVLSYGLFRWAGFKGLSVFYILLLIAALGLALDSARRYSSFIAALFVGVVSFLLLTCRPDIRPEDVSVLFMVLYFWLLQGYAAQKISGQAVLLTITILQIIWVNTHIFFIMGPLLTGLFLWQARLTGAGPEMLKVLRRVFLISVVVNLINPSGLWGMLTPLNAFKKFGYTLAENQSVFFMIRRFPDSLTYKYWIICALLLIVGMFLVWRREKARALPLIGLAVVITLASFKAVRLIMPFSFMFIPLAAYFYAPYLNKPAAKIILGFVATVGLIACAFIMPFRPGLGLMPGVNASAEFFKKEGLKGPVFSNYDIGGYLIYHLWGQERLFVDNRWEAYPPDFFDKIYIPMQEDQRIWEKEQAEYGFNVIYFDRHDLTPWGQGFLVKRIQDPLWAPVFVDAYTIIFVRRGSVDEAVIDRYELPKSMFKVTVT